MRILIGGARGLIGRRLCAWFSSRGENVVPLVRVGEDGPVESGVAWNPSTGWIDREGMERSDVLVHLGGENIARGRWSRARKERIRHSRVEGTSQIARALSSLRHPPRHFLCASAIGYYPPSTTRAHREEDPPGAGFLSRICEQWEAAAMEARDIPVTLMRFGVVLDPAGGALGGMLMPFLAGFGGRMGHGRQWLSWIGVTEIGPVIDHLLRLPDPPTGPVNLVAPHPVTNAEFTRILGARLRRPAWCAVPATAIRLVLGEMGEEMLLSSWKVEPRFLVRSGYTFRHPDLRSCLDALLPPVR